MADNFKYAQVQPFTLAGAGAVLGATTITLSSFNDIDGNPLAMSNFGLIGFGTIQPGGSTFEEQIAFTGVVQNANGTATLTGIHTVTFLYPYTETSGLAKSHAGGSVFVISNTSGFYDGFPAKANDETVTGDWTFTGNITFDNFPVTPSNSNASSTVKGVTKLSIDPVLNTNPIAVGDNDSRMPVAYAVDSAGSDAYAITPSPAISAYVAGQVFTFKAGTANTGASTLAVSGLAAKAIKKNVSSDLTTGDILLGQIVMVEYDGVNMQLLSRPSLPANDTQTFTGSGTWTKPAFGTTAMIQLWAGGGSGGKGDNSHFAGGGGGGAYNLLIIPLASLGATETVTIGAGGASQTSANSDGNVGGNSTFGSWLTVYGGGAGAGGSVNGGGGGGGGASSVGLVGQSATTPNGGNGGGPVGGVGGTGAGADAGGFGGGAGGGGSPAAASGGFSVYGGAGGGNGLTGTSGTGGNSIYGGAGGGGKAAAGGTSKAGGAGGAGGSGSGNGTDGSQPSGGGGGSVTGNSGAGGAGKCIVTVY